MVFHDFGSKVNLQQNGHHLKALFMMITMVQIPAPYLIPSPRNYKYWCPVAACPRHLFLHTVSDQKLRRPGNEAMHAPRTPSTTGDSVGVAVDM